jgi:hypothetical protein
MKVRLFLSIAVACCVAYPWQWLAAEEEIKYPSPDGKFALRITQSKDAEYHPTVELIEKSSGKVILTLHVGSESDAFDPSECVLVWSADSKRVAYGFRANPPGARILDLGTLVCFWNGSGFDKVFLPENLPQPDIKFPKGKRRERETLRGRGEAVEVVEVGRSGDVQRGHDALAR